METNNDQKIETNKASRPKRSVSVFLILLVLLAVAMVGISYLLKWMIA